ncbi:uncharacterized protein LOC132295101 isoform X2 [Cornus florida]|uniref:uncharacterized protein LOC132295101 isoform X2 n=1 Tax=Cornus florida TaxID=4283 RepID=UPI002896D955|nr:uncharacterized protein LOC132295101 isoform X2 [Cornus florida]
MATLIISNPSSSTLALTHHHKLAPRTLFNTPYVSNSRSLRFTVDLGRRRRHLSLVTRAGPTTSNYIFAFVLPLSLLAITIFTSIRIADRLDKKFLEESGAIWNTLELWRVSRCI